MSTPEGKPRGWWARRSLIQRVATVVIGAVVALSAIGLVDQFRTPPDRPSVDAAQARAFRAEAYDACKGFVKDHLGQPATAAFVDGNVRVAKGHATGEWTVSGDVSSESGFGQSLRQHFACSMLMTGVGTWASEHVVLSQ